MLKPQDIVLALYLTGAPARTQGAIGHDLGLSQAEISNSIRRLQASRLLLQDARTVIVPNLIEFCVHGLKYSHPARIGRRTSGIPTAALIEPLKGRVSTEEGDLVWPAPQGVRAASIEPLHRCVLHAVQGDRRLHQLLALIDGVRVGKSRMSQVSERLLKELLYEKELLHEDERVA